MTTRLVSPPVPVGSGDFVMPIKEDDTTVPVHSSTGSWCSTCKGPVGPSEPRDASAAVKIMVPQTEAQCASSSRVGNVVASPLSCASTWLATSPSSSVLSLSPTSVGLPTRQPAATHVASNSGAKGALPVHNAAAVDAARKGFRYRVVPPGEFEGERHFYPRVLNAQIHPTVRYFMGLSKERVVKRYTHLHPQVDGVKLMALLSSEPRFLKWAGCDLIHTTDSKGGKSMAVIETNSCPSGMKSTPLFEEMEEEGGYRALLERTFLPMLPEASLRVPGGGLAVLYDKNPMETTGYAAALANLTGEHVHLVPLLMDQVALSVGGQGSGCRARFVKGVLQILTDEGHWVNIRAALRYVTQRPWDRVPMDTLTLILNPIVGCLAGGRNKSVAAKAYARLNDSLALQQSGLQIMTPLTVCDVSWEELPSWVNRMGGVCVIKIPYSNAGQGVYTITSPHEFQAFQHAEQGNVYQRFVVQSLIANHTWSSLLPPAPLAHPTQDGQQQGGSRVLYHVGTMPDKRGDIYVSDLRLMVSASPKGFRVVGIYGRKAKKPLTDALEPGADSWAMLGTNLSVKVEDGLFSSESERLLLVDRRDYNTLGLGLDDLIEAFVQTVLAVTAIDHMCTSLMPKGVFSRARFEEVNDDPGLLHEIAASGGYAWGQGQGPEEGDEEEEGLEVGEHHRAFAS